MKVFFLENYNFKLKKYIWNNLLYLLFGQTSFATIGKQNSSIS